MKTLTLTTIFGLLFFFIPLTLAQGCFLYQDSTYFCVDISEQEAQAECSFYLDCNIATHFQTTSCLSLSECQQILCKSSCTYEFIGQCSAGEVPLGEEDQWCQPGCCTFTSTNVNYCDYKENKGLCEVEAKNKNVFNFNFDLLKSKEECKHGCGLPLIEEQNVNAPATFFAQEEIPAAPTEQNLTKTSTSLWPIFIGIIIIVFIAVLAYLIFTNRISFIKTEPESFSTADKPHKSSFMSFIPNPFVQARLNHLKARHQLKVKEKQREDFFTELGIPLESLTPNHVKELEKIVKSYEKGLKGISMEEKQVFKKLAFLVGGKQKNLSKKTKKDDSKDKKIQEIIAQLKSIVKKS